MNPLNVDSIRFQILMHDSKSFIARGNASKKSAGIIVAISEQASQLDPNCNAPVVSLEVGDK